MQRLFDHDVATPARPKADPAKKRREVDAEELHAGAPRDIWRALLDYGADPVALAGLLRSTLSASERRSAYLELVRDLGAPLARHVWDDAFFPPLQRRAFPVSAQELAELASGTRLVGIHAVTGALVDLVASKIGTPAFTLGSEVFVTGDVASGDSHAVMVHEAIHAAQQQGSSAK
ncbi:MAG: hypothetical protein JWM53_2578 [bacterium]|nr:hypothetical protein [bacterium]